MVPLVLTHSLLHRRGKLNARSTDPAAAQKAMALTDKPQVPVTRGDTSMHLQLEFGDVLTKEGKYTKRELDLSPLNKYKLWLSES